MGSCPYSVLRQNKKRKMLLSCVRYQYKDGVTAESSGTSRVTQTTTFTRPVSVNKVAGVKTPGQWNKPSEEPRLILSSYWFPPEQTKRSSCSCYSTSPSLKMGSKLKAKMINVVSLSM